ncbi:MAG: TlpA family protein disulfide reductase [Candidatus Marinimicrobia bacterium]|nr:TlpA family protein disulfide reductase [Candidatus Neomarinimicrobiota bacterium]
MRKKTILISVSVLIVSMILIMGCSKQEQTEQTGQKTEQSKASAQNNTMQEKFIGSEAPEFELETLSGEKVTLDQFEGKVVLLNFWATWCPPCKKEIPDLDKMHSEHKSRGLEVVGITLNSGTPEKIQQFVNNNDMNYHVLTGEQKYTMNLAKKYDNITGIPTSFVIDRDGVVRHKWVGPRSKEQFMKIINKYL